MKYLTTLQGFPDSLLSEIMNAQEEMDWLRRASAQDLVDLAATQLGVERVPDMPQDLTARQLGNLRTPELLDLLEPFYLEGTSTARDLADQIQICRAFSNPEEVTDHVASLVEKKVREFPKKALDLKVGKNRGDVLDPYILAANFELLSERSLSKTIEHTASHKVLMKIEDMAGHLHEETLSRMRGNFRVPEPNGKEGKEELHPFYNPFPGADVGQVPLEESPDKLRLFQVKSKTGSAKGGDGKRLGLQLKKIEDTYKADTFYVAVVGNTLIGHRSKGAVLKASPNTAVLVGEASLNELTQSNSGAELLLRLYQRAFRVAAKRTGYKFSELVLGMIASFETEAEEQGADFLTAWLHNATDGPRREQDSRLQ